MTDKNNKDQFKHYELEVQKNRVLQVMEEILLKDGKINDIWLDYKFDEYTRITSNPKIWVLHISLEPQHYAYFKNKLTHRYESIRDETVIACNHVQPQRFADRSKQKCRL